MRAALRPIGQVLRSPLWVSVAAVTALGTLLLSVWLPNLGLIAHVITTGDRPLGDKVRFLWASLGAIATTFTRAQASLTVAIALLFGLDVAVMLRTVRLRARERSVAGMSLAGITVGLFGVGCSACGAVVLSALLGAGTTAALVRALPLRGLEFGIAGVLVLIAALAVTARQAARLDTCDVPDASRSGPPTLDHVRTGRS